MGLNGMTYKRNTAGKKGERLKKREKKKNLGTRGGFRWEGWNY